MKPKGIFPPHFSPCGPSASLPHWPHCLLLSRPCGLQWGPVGGQPRHAPHCAVRGASPGSPSPASGATAPASEPKKLVLR